MTTQNIPPMGAPAHELLQMATAVGAPRINPDDDGKAYAVVPTGWHVEELPQRTYPERASGTAQMRDAPSFIAYVNKHKGSATTLYAQLEPAQFLAVFDDFHVITGDDQLAAVADLFAASNWRQWRAHFQVPASREWMLWNAKNRNRMNQLQFAEFLQDNLPDVAQPDGATLLAMALNFEAAREGRFIAAQRLHDGSHNLQWREETNAAGTVQLPEFIKLAIPVFENGDTYELAARLRYRVTDGSLAIWFELVRPHKVLEDAFHATWDRIKEGTALPILLGSPE